MMNCIKFIPDNALNLNIRKSVGGRGFPEHLHDCTELAIMLKGCPLHIVNGKRHNARAGDVYVIKPGVSHGLECEEPFDHYVFSYMPDILDLIASDLRQTIGFQVLFAIGHGASAEFDSMLHLSYKSLGRLEQLVDSMILELKERKPGYVSLVKARFVEFVALLSREYLEADALQGTPLDIARAAKLASHLETHYKEEIEMPQVARTLGVSERQLRRIFQRHYNLAPVEYLLRVRIGHAADLLSNSDRTLSEIAFACGFYDANYLSRQFKKMTGASPRLWRARFQEKT